MSKCMGETFGNVHVLYPEFGVSDLKEKLGEVRGGSIRAMLG